MHLLLTSYMNDNMLEVVGDGYDLKRTTRQFHVKTSFTSIIRDFAANNYFLYLERSCRSLGGGGSRCTPVGMDKGLDVSIAPTSTEELQINPFRAIGVAPVSTEIIRQGCQR